MLIGRFVTLRVMERNDAELIRHWKNDPQNYNYFANRHFVSDSRQEEWIERQAVASDAMYLIIIDNESRKPIGMTLFTNIDHRNQTACWGIYIADTEYRRRVFAVESVRLLFDYAFDYLNLRKIYGNTLESNERGRRFHQSVGFQEEATFHNHVFADGEYQDLIWIALHEVDWVKIRTDLNAYLETANRKQDHA